VNQLDFENKYSYYDWIDISHGTRGAIAKYRTFHQKEYNDNPMIKTLPPIFSQERFIELVAKYPDFDPGERNMKPRNDSTLLKDYQGISTPLPKPLIYNKQFQFY